MGTRNLTAVFLNGKYKVAQYAQWDGYPEGQGARILDFLSYKENVEKLKANLSKVRYLDHDGVDKEFLKSYNANAPEWSNEPDNRTPEQRRWWNTYQSRDLGAKILQNIRDSKDDEIVLSDNIAFAGDSLMCEWAYVIDFDKGTLEVHRGFNKSTLGGDERFKDSPIKKESDYSPVNLVKEFKLDDLPTEEEFLDSLKEDEDEDEDE